MKAKTSGPNYPSNSVGLFFKLFTIILVGLPFFWVEARDNEEYYYSNRVEIFEDANFQGRSVTLYPDQREFDLSEMDIYGYKNNFDNHISSVKVYGDAIIILYQHDGLQGESLEIHESIRNLDDYFMYDADAWWADENWNDEASSLEVYVEFGAKLYEQNYYDGDYLYLEVGESIPDLYELTCYSGGTWDNLISSITLSKGVVVVLYEEPYYEGKSIQINYDTARLRRAPDFFGSFGSWNNRASSLRVIVANEVDTYFPVSPLVLFPFPDIFFHNRFGHYYHRDLPYHRYPKRHHRRNNPRVWKEYPVVLFQHVYYEGDWSGLHGADRFPNLRALGMHDRVSSVYVRPGYSVTFYEHEHYRGRSVTMTFSEEDLRYLYDGQRSFNWSDQFSSMIIHPSGRPPSHGGGYGDHHHPGHPGYGNGHGDGWPGHGRPGHINDGPDYDNPNPRKHRTGKGNQNDITIVNQDQTVIVNTNNSTLPPKRVSKPVFGTKPPRSVNTKNKITNQLQVNKPYKKRPFPKPTKVSKSETYRPDSEKDNKYRTTKPPRLENKQKDNRTQTQVNKPDKRRPVPKPATVKKSKITRTRLEYKNKYKTTSNKRPKAQTTNHRSQTVRKKNPPKTSPTKKSSTVRKIPEEKEKSQKRRSIVKESSPRNKRTPPPPPSNKRTQKSKDSNSPQNKDSSGYKSRSGNKRKQ